MSTETTTMMVCGVKTAYRHTGSGRDVILLHGWGQNMYMMSAIETHLSPHFSVWNLDFPGFGESDEPPVPWGMEEYTGFLSEFIRQNGIEEPILIGHSFGCRAAIQAAHQEEALRKLQDRSGSQDYRNAHGVMRDTFVKVVNDDVSPVLSEVKCPVLLVWGSLDTAAPLWMGQQMEKEMPDAGLAVFEGDDHFAYWNQADRFNRVLDIFLKEDMI